MRCGRKWVFFLNTGSGSTSDPVDQNYDFWKEVEIKILASADNATVSVNAGEYGRMPVSVLNALRSRKNVTLKITYQGKTISITSQKAPVAAGDRIYWSLDELIKLFGASSGNSNHNPGTGSTDLPASLAVLALLASAAAVVSIRKKR